MQGLVQGLIAQTGTDSRLATRQDIDLACSTHQCHMSWSCQGRDQASYEDSGKSALNGFKARMEV